MVTGSFLTQLTTGHFRSGATSADHLPELMRELGTGRAVVVFDRSALIKGAVELATSVLRDDRLRFTSVEARGGHETSLDRTLDSLRILNGALVISLGDARTIALGKATAAAANNGDVTAHTGGAPLPRAPLPHIAVPTGIWPPEESTDTIDLSPTEPTHPSGVIRDPRLAPSAVIDARLHSYHHQDTVDHAIAEGLAVATCAATDPTRTLDEKTRALAAAHALTPRSRACSHFEMRVALSLAGASHRDYLLCRRCKAGHRLCYEGVAQATTPAEACLSKAFGSS